MYGFCNIYCVKLFPKFWLQKNDCKKSKRIRENIGLYWIPFTRAHSNKRKENPKIRPNNFKPFKGCLP